MTETEADHFTAVVVMKTIYYVIGNRICLYLKIKHRFALKFVFKKDFISNLHDKMTLLARQNRI